MLLIIAGAHDAEARAAADWLGPEQAVVLDATDLSRPGWCLLAHEPGSGTIVAGGRELAVRRLQGILVRRLAVYPQELGHVHADDRDYVASEMTALLAWWLRVVPVPVLNRPGRAALCGPGWRHAEWRACARRLGFPVAHLPPVTVAGHVAAEPKAATEIVLVGELLVGEAQPEMVKCLQALAAAANATMIQGVFDGSGALVTAHPLPPLTKELLAAVRQHARLAAAKPEITPEAQPEVWAGTRLCAERL